MSTPLISNETQLALAKSVQALRASSPDAWAQFMIQLARRLEELTEKMVDAPADRLVEFQGRAREARALYKDLYDAPKLANAIADKEKANGKTSR